MSAARRLPEALAGLVDLGRAGRRVLGSNRSCEYVGEDASGVLVRGGLVAGRDDTTTAVNVLPGTLGSFSARTGLTATAASWPTARDVEPADSALMMTNRPTTPMCRVFEDDVFIGIPSRS